MAAPDLMAIMEYTGGAVKVLQDFTDDREKLLTVIGTIIAGEGQGFDEDPRRRQLGRHRRGVRPGR